MSKLITFVKTLNLDVSKIKINFSKVGYICGYIKGLIAAIIIDAFLTGGVKAVEDITKAIGQFLSKPGTVLRDVLKTAGRKTVATIEAVIDLIAQLASKLKNGAVKLFEDFKGLVDDIFKWLEEFFGTARKSADEILDYIKLSEELVQATKSKILIQNSNNLDELYSAATVADKELKVITTNFATETKGEAGFRDGLKSKERALEKIESDYAGDASKLVDIAGSKVVYETVEDLYIALNEFIKEYKILKIKNRIQKPLNGYRDILMNIEMKNGHIVEFRLHLREMDEVANGIGHKLYEQQRSLDAILLKRSLTRTEKNLYKELISKQNKLYEEAWDKIIKNKIK